MLNSDYRERELSVEFVLHQNLRELMKRLERDSGGESAMTIVSRDGKVSKTTLSHLMRRPMSVTTSTLEKLARGLGCTECDLLDRRRCLDGLVR